MNSLDSASAGAWRLINRLAAVAVRSLMRLKNWLRKRRKIDELVDRSKTTLTFEKLRVHDVMLADDARVSAYETAIAANVKEGDVVVDLGTGTGILACMARRQRPRVVYGIDVAPLDLARALAHANGLDPIRFERIHSREFQPPEPVDVIIHEQIGDYVFDERMVGNITELRDRVLRPGGRILPNRIDVFFEPIELHARVAMPLIWEHRIAGLDFSIARDFAAGQRRYPGFRFVDQEWIAQRLSEPRPAISFDLEKVQLADIPTRLDLEREVVVGGVQHGFLGYFTARFDDETTLTNDPLAGPRSFHWSPMLLRTETHRRERGETIEFTLTAKHIERPETWRWY